MNCAICTIQIDETNAAKTIYSGDPVLCATCERLCAEIVAKVVRRAVAEQLEQFDTVYGGQKTMLRYQDTKEVQKAKQARVPQPISDLRRLRGHIEVLIKALQRSAKQNEEDARSCSLKEEREPVRVRAEEQRRVVKLLKGILKG